MNQHTHNMQPTQATGVPFDRDTFLASLPETLSPERREVAERLASRPWFAETNPELRDELLGLPENHHGFLDDLANRPDEIAGVQVEKLVGLPRGNFALVPTFQVYNPKQDARYTYEYVSWKQGPHSGAKGIVFVRPPLPGASPTHFIVMVGDKFAPGKKSFDLIGGFVELDPRGVEKAGETALREIREETGVEDLHIDEVVDLGQLQIDAGMTNNNPGIFAAFTDTEQADRIPADPINTDITELASGALKVPMSQLKQFVLENTDAFFQAAMLKALVSGNVPWEWLARD